MKKIKIGYFINDLANGGAESVMYNYLSHMNLSQFEVILITYAVSDLKCKKKFIDLGIKIYQVAPKRQHFFKSCKDIAYILKQEKFDIIHAHMTEWNCVPLFLAFMYHVKIRISHSHMANSMASGLLAKSILFFEKVAGRIVATNYFACGKEAGKNLFGDKFLESKKVIFINNAIEYEKFKFNPNYREQIRSKLGLHNEICIGNIARFSIQKNHMFLLDIFESFIKIRPDSKLLLIGCGPLEEKIRIKVKEKKLTNNVIFYGTTNHINLLYQAIDILLLPSLYEGLPVVAIEAQAASLPIICSSNISEEVLLTESICEMSLSRKPMEWAKKIIEYDNYQRRDTTLEIRKAGYDIREESRKLEQLYLSFIYKQFLKGL